MKDFASAHPEAPAPCDHVPTHGMSRNEDILDHGVDYNQ